MNYRYGDIPFMFTVGWVAVSSFCAILNAVSSTRKQTLLVTQHDVTTLLSCPRLYSVTTQCMARKFTQTFARLVRQWPKALAQLKTSTYKNCHRPHHQNHITKLVRKHFSLCFQSLTRVATSHHRFWALDSEKFRMLVGVFSVAHAAGQVGVRFGIWVRVNARVH